MRAGAFISAVGHCGLLLLVIFWNPDSGRFNYADIEVADVALISEAEWNALMPDSPDPEPDPPMAAVPEVAPAPEPEPEPEAEPEVAPEPQPAPEPDPEPQPAPQPAPEPIVEAVPASEAQDQETNGTFPPVPQDERVVVSVSEKETDTESDEPVRQAAPRVAPEVAPEPEPEVKTDEQERAAAQPDEAAEPVVEEQPETETARRHTALETVTEAEQTEAAALTLTRPMRRPPRPAVADEPLQERPSEPEPALNIDEPLQQPESDPEPAETEMSIADLIKQAESELGSSAGAAISGIGGSAPLTASESEGLKRAIQSCWNFAALSDEAKRVAVTLEVELDLTGTPVPGSIKLLGASGGAASARTTAFEAGRRAIRRCLNSGFELPEEKFEHWRVFEVVFDPEEMRAR